jgi:Protein of unknown function (DUF3224)
MSSRASGTFEVDVAPQTDADTPISRLSLDKQFSGDLVGTSKGEMLAAGTEVPGSAGYVAMEKVSGTISGRAGTFVLQHMGTMTRGTPELKVSVVPDSGTGQLKGLAGTMIITITDGKHFYDFDYTLSEEL